MKQELEARQPDSPQHYTEADIEQGLSILALHGGNARRAAEILDGEGRPIPERTLEAWRDTVHAVRYENTLARLRQEIGTQVSDQAMEIATGAAVVEAELVRKAGETLGALEPKELTKAALNMSILKKNNIEAARVLRNEPTVVVESRDVGDTLDALKTLGVINMQKESPDAEGE